MTRAPLRVFVLATSLLAVACEGRELTVFDLPASLGKAGAGGAGGAGAQGMIAAPPSGASNGGVVADSAGGGGSENGGSNAGGGVGPSCSGTGGMPPTPCTSKADCSPGWTCDTRGCQNPTGLCVPWPTFCPPSPSPVCGCDGVTYWNDCIRLSSAATLAAPDQCRATACTCQVGADCKVPQASCSHLLAPGDVCGHAIGSCWVLPLKCDASADTKMWHECMPADPNAPVTCVNTCQAIASERSYAQYTGDKCN